MYGTQYNNYNFPCTVDVLTDRLINHLNHISHEVSWTNVTSANFVQEGCKRCNLLQLHKAILSCHKQVPQIGNWR